jgi:Encapsulating protein for peroxidase
VSHLLRGQAPVTEAGWVLLDSEARERLTPALAARRLVDFAGPHGWAHSATNLGRTQDLADSPEEGIAARQRRVLGLVELRAPFTVPRTELEGADRGAEDIELGALDEAAHRIARAENSAVFHGWSAAGIAGVIEASPHEEITLGEDCERYPRHVARRQSRRHAPRGRYRGRLRPRARPGDSHPGPRDQPARWVSPARAPARDPRRPDRVGARGRRRRRCKHAGGRFPLRLRPGPFDRIRAPRRGRRPPVPGGELQLQGRDARGGRAASSVNRSARV